MDMQGLTLCLEVARRGSFAAVARDRGVDPSSVSRAVSNVEAQLGIALFVRTTRSLTPTVAGEAYLATIAPALETLTAAAARAREATTTTAGRVRLLAPVSFALRNVVPLVADLRARHPELELDLVLTDALLDLVVERIDLAIRLGPLEPSSLIARRLSPLRARICASPGYLEEHGRPQRPGDLEDHPCLLLEMPGFGARWSFREPGGSRTEVRVSGPLATSNALALEQLAIAGQGIIAQGEWIVGQALADGRLVDLFPDHEVTASSFDNAAWLLRPPLSATAERVLAVESFILEAFARGAPGAGAAAPASPPPTKES